MEKIYDVLARVKREAPLHIVGSIKAPTDNLAVVYASKTYDEFSYIEMKVVPRESIIDVFTVSQLKRKSS